MKKIHSQYRDVRRVAFDSRLENLVQLVQVRIVFIDGGFSQMVASNGEEDYQLIDHQCSK